MSVTFDNTTFTAAQSETGAYALNNFTGTATLSGVAPVTINGTIDHPNSQVTISLNDANITATNATGTYLGYSPADNNGNYVYYFSVNGGGLSTPVTIGVTNGPALPALNVLTAVNSSNVTAPVCFVTGTLIRTARGDVAIEDLIVGEEVLTASGAHRPIVWIGHRDVDHADAPERVDALPIRIRAGAVAPGLPARDLVVSPGHRLFLDDVLVQACMLVNGTTIVRERIARLTYWHVELESHDVILAEGLPAETYVEAANRATFDNGEIVFGRRPHFSVAISAPLCAPLVDEGPILHAIRARLLARAAELGARGMRDPGLQLVADDLVLTPLAAHDWRFRYEVPEGTERLVLRSRSAVPQETQPTSGDQRRLGVCVTALVLDGAGIAIDDARLGAGWNEPEAETTFRWTDGEAVLPVARTVEVRATPLPTYTVRGIRDPLAGAGPDEAMRYVPSPLKLVA